MNNHRNNIGLLRLTLASLVIVGHSPEMIDGNRHREPLTLLFHTLSLGDVAVDGFFLISGYLITMSMAQSPSLIAYLRRRVFRIFPAFIVAYLLSVILLAPLVGGHLERPLRVLTRLFLLQSPPEFPGQFAGLPYPALNGSMWTIAYEFRCYLLVALMGVTGLLARRRTVLALTLLAVVAAIAETFGSVHGWSNAFDARWRAQTIVGALDQTVRLTATFMIGVCIYNYRDQIFPRLSARLAMGSFIVMIPLMFFPHTAETAVTVLGAVWLFWLGFKAQLGPVQRINDRWDVSYGVYLYGWPVAISVLWIDRSISPGLLAVVALPVSLAFGAMSWWGLEKSMNEFGRRKPKQTAPQVAAPLDGG